MIIINVLKDILIITNTKLLMFQWTLDKLKMHNSKIIIVIANNAVLLLHTPV
jgi:hypothetical protein